MDVSMNIEEADQAEADQTEAEETTFSYSKNGGDITFNPLLHVKIDEAACRALHVTLNAEEAASKHSSTLGSVFDKCRTAQGRRLLAEYMKFPLIDKEKLEERLDIVESLIEDVYLRQSLFEEHLRKVPDCQVLSKKFSKKKASLFDCYKGYQCITKLDKLIEDLNNYEGEKKEVLKVNFIDPLLKCQDELGKYKEMVESTLDLEQADKGDYVVKAEFDIELGVLRTYMDQLASNMAKETEEAACELDIDLKSIKLEFSAINGHYFRVTSKVDSKVRNNDKFIVVDAKRGGVFFRNGELEKLNKKYIKKREKYEAVQQRIVDELLEVIETYANSFLELGRVLSNLDVLVSFAYVSTNSTSIYVRPILREMGTGVINFQNLRHPCVESQPGSNFIPNDVNFIKGEESFFIVTGPNMGGKSTFLRSVGVGVLLAHIGCFVPADKAEISIVDAILARVGAGDNIQKGMSTFMAEMVETSNILQTATNNSLVLIDELGRGTSTYDGLGLCWGISEHLATKVNCFCILATHFNELTDLANEVKSVVNLHVTAIADEKGITMLYKVERGTCDRSFGLHVAQLVDFPDEVIEKGKLMAKKLDDNSHLQTEFGFSSKKNGQLKMEDFLNKVDNLALNSVDDTQFQNEVIKLFSQLDDEEDPYIKSLMAEAVSNM